SPAHPVLKTTVQKTTTSRNITLVQGPPGTGKTTFLVALLLALLSDPSTRRQRTLVCAPSNRAVLVVASRFLKSIQRQSPNSIPSACLVGVESKLAEDASDSSGSQLDLTSVDSIFAWSYHERLEAAVASALSLFRSSYPPAPHRAAAALSKLADLATYVSRKTPHTYREIGHLFPSPDSRADDDVVDRLAALRDAIAGLSSSDLVAELLANCRKWATRLRMIKKGTAKPLFDSLSAHFHSPASATPCRDPNWLTNVWETCGGVAVPLGTTSHCPVGFVFVDDLATDSDMVSIVGDLNKEGVYPPGDDYEFVWGAPKDEEVAVTLFVRRNFVVDCVCGVEVIDPDEYTAGAIIKNYS
ncbi:hypothetical protein TeGR_g11238, partial [Tetraparma gracilis]